MTLHTVSLRGCLVLAALGLFACRYDYEVLSLEREDTSTGGGLGTSTGSGTGGQAGAPDAVDAGGATTDSGGNGTGGSGGSAALASGSGGSASGSSGGSNASGSGGTASSGGTGSGGSGGVTPIAHCNELPKLASAPDLNGEPEPGLYKEQVAPMGWSGSEPLPSGVSMEFSAAWHESGLYFYIEVTDPDLVLADASDPLWYGDGVEMYVDHDGTMSAPPGSYDEGTKQLVVQAPADDMNDSARGDLFVPVGLDRAWPGTQWIGKYRSFGYAVEALVVAADLDLLSWDLQAGNRVGIDLGHNVSYPDPQGGPWGNRLGQYFLSIGNGGGIDDVPFWNSAVFCTPVLLDAQ